MSNYMKALSPEQLRGLIGETKARLAGTERPCKRWLVHLTRTRTITDCRLIAVEAKEVGAALAATLASRDCLKESDDWEQWEPAEVKSIDADGYSEEPDVDPHYRVNADGELEKIV